MAQTPFATPSGSAATFASRGFRTAVLDNDTNQWVFNVETGQYIQGFCRGWIQTLSGPTFTLTFQAPPGVVQPTVNTSQSVKGYFTTDILAPSAGSVYNPGTGAAGLQPSRISSGVVVTKTTLTGATVILVPDTTPFGVGDEVLIAHAASVERIPGTLLSIQPGVSITMTGATIADTVAGDIVVSYQPVSIRQILNAALTVQPAAGALWDVSDRVARLLGHASLDTGGTLVGQKTMANSVPVAVASDQSALPARLSSSGFAFTSASRAIGTYNFVLPTPLGGKGLFAEHYVTAGSGTVTATVDERCVSQAAGSANRAILSSTAITNGGDAHLRVYPGLTASANAIANDIISEGTLLSYAVATNSATFAGEYSVVP